MALLLVASAAKAAPPELRYGPSLRLTAEYVRLLVLNRVDRAAKRESFDFIIARPGAGSKGCPTEGVLSRTSWKPGTPLLLPQSLSVGNPQAEVFVVAAGDKGGCSSRGILNFDPREVALTLDTEEGAFQYRVGVADIVGNVLRLPYVDEMNLSSTAARCEVSVVDNPTTVIPAVRAGQGSCANLPLGLPIRVRSPKNSNLVDLDFRVVGVPFRFRAQGGQCPSAPTDPKTAIPSVDGTAVVCAYEEAGDGDWSLVASDYKLELLKLLSLRFCAAGSEGGADAWCRDTDATETLSEAVDIGGIPTGKDVWLQIGGTKAASASGASVLAAHQVKVPLGALLDLPWLRQVTKETLVAPNPECAIDEAECAERDEQDRVVDADVGWLCYPTSVKTLDALARTQTPLGLRVSIGSARAVDVAVAGWSERPGYLCPKLLQEGKNQVDSKILTLTPELVTTLRQTVEDGTLRVIFSFLDRDILDRAVISGRDLELSTLTFRDRNGRLGAYESVNLPAKLNGELCVSYEGYPDAQPEEIYLPLDRFVLKEARDLSSVRDLLKTLLAPQPGGLITDVGPDTSDWLKLKRHQGQREEPRTFCGKVIDLEFGDARDLAFQPVTLANRRGQDCASDSGCAKLDPTPGNYLRAVPTMGLGFGVNGNVGSLVQSPRHAGAAPGLSLQLLAPIIEVGRHLGRGVRLPQVEAGLRAGITVTVRQGELQEAHQQRTSYFAYEPLGIYLATCLRTQVSIGVGLCVGAHSSLSVDFLADTPAADGKTNLKVGFSIPVNGFAAIVF